MSFKKSSSTSMRSARRQTNATQMIAPGRAVDMKTSSGPQVVVSARSRSRSEAVFATDSFRRDWENDVPFDAANLVHLRRCRGWSQARVAKLIGTSQSAIARIENEDGNITLNTLQRLATAMKARLRLSFPPEEIAMPPAPAWWSSLPGSLKGCWTVKGVVFQDNGAAGRKAAVFLHQQVASETTRPAEFRLDTFEAETLEAAPQTMPTKKTKSHSRKVSAPPATDGGTPSIAFLGFEVTRLAFSVVQASPPTTVDDEAQNAPTRVHFNLTYGLNAETAKVRLEVVVKPNVLTQPMILKLNIAGVFGIQSGTQEQLEQFCRVHSAALLFLYVREYVSRLTSDGPHGRILLAPINVAKFINQSNWKITNDSGGGLRMPESNSAELRDRE